MPLDTAPHQGAPIERTTMQNNTKVTKALPVAGLAAAAMGLALIVSPTAAADTHLVGPGCAAYAQQVPTGPGSVGDLAKVPVATAAANSPVLTTLAAALSGGLNPQVNLVDTLNGGQFTVFAPTNDAFAKLDPATIDKLKTDSTLLSSILTYHVVAGQAAPDQVVGTHKTVNGATVTVSGMGDHLMVNNATVVCGGITATNATIYLIDTVLLPPAS
jgi:uncharacterized surface protein with fasciclin (FAS1) repeats